jgi:uncharacterized phage-like protein YoqJ
MKPYKEINNTGDSLIREFDSNIDPSELVWHRDKQNRLVEVLNDTDWLFQYDNEIPMKLKKGDKFFINKNEYHRVIKGNSNLKIKIEFINPSL